MAPGSNILVVGGGIAGLATAWWLGRLGDAGGAKVTLLEGESDLGRHSTGRNASIFRSAIPDPTTRLLADRTRVFLQHPPDGFATGPLLEPCGLIVITAAGSDPEWWPTSSPGARELTPDERRALAPHFVPSAGRAFLFPEEGRVDVPLLRDSLARGAREAGVRVRTGARVESLLTDPSGVHGVLLADGSELRADRTVLAAGGWAGRLGEAAGSRVSLTPTRRHIGVSEPDARMDPAGPIVWSDVDGFYARPEAGGLLLSSCDQTSIDPDRCDEDPSVQGQILDGARSHLRLDGVALEPSLARFWAGQRTLTADGRFLVGPDGDVCNLFWVAGLGGHGISTSIETGRVAAEALLDLTPEDPDLAAALRPTRPAALGMQPG